MTYKYFKYLSRSNKAFSIAKNAKYDEYQSRLASMVHKMFDKKHLVEVLKMRIFLTKD